MKPEINRTAGKTDDKNYMRIFWRVVFAVLIGCIICGGLSFCIKNLKVVLSKSTSPDNRFTVVTYVYRRIISEGSHRPGLLCLYNQQTGAELQRIRVDVGAIDRIEWSPTNVLIQPIIVWPLPPIEDSPPSEKHVTD
jgi:hypothetical protein